MPGTAAPTAVATTHPLAPMRGAAQFQTATVAPALVRRTTQKRGHLAPRCKVPMLVGVGEASTVSKNGNAAYSQHQTTSQGTTGQIQTSNGSSAYGVAVKTATAPPWVRPQTVTSTRQRTATPTKTPAAVGRTQMEVPIPLLLGATEGRKRVAAHQPSVGAVAEAGNPGRPVHVVRRAEVAVVAGESHRCKLNQR